MSVASAPVVVPLAPPLTWLPEHVRAHTHTAATLPPELHSAAFWRRIAVTAARRFLVGWSVNSGFVVLQV
jgi:hypothetical protein